MRPYAYAFASLLIPVALAACGGPDREAVVVQPQQQPTIVTTPPPPQPVVVAPPPSDVSVNHGVVGAYGGTLHLRPDPQSAVVTTLSAGTEVAVVGSAGGGTWAHVATNGVDGYMPRSELQ